MKYTFIKDHKKAHAIKLMSRVLDVSTRGYYDWLDRVQSKRAAENKKLLVEIKTIFYANREVYGAPRIYEELIENGIQCSLNRVARLMKKACIIPKTI